MNIIAKLSTSVAGMADQDAVGSSPSGGVGSEGWAEDVLRRAGLPVSRPRRLVLEALRGRDRPVTAQDLYWELKLDTRAASTRHRAAGLRLCAACRPDPAAQPHLAACPAADEHRH
jgi:hypothetical protein